MLIATGLAACGAPTATSRYASKSTSILWYDHIMVKDPLQLAFIEAELGARGETTNSITYLGKRTSSALNRDLYARNGTVVESAGGAACSDFPNAGQAQRYFLASGGPLADPSNLDVDGDGLACKWGGTIARISRNNAITTPARSYSHRSSSACYTGPRGGTYTITSGGNKNYGGC